MIKFYLILNKWIIDFFFVIFLLQLFLIYLVLFSYEQIFLAPLIFYVQIRPWFMLFSCLFVYRRTFCPIHHSLSYGL